MTRHHAIELAKLQIGTTLRFDNVHHIILLYLQFLYMQLFESPRCRAARTDRQPDWHGSIRSDLCRGATAPPLSVTDAVPLVRAELFQERTNASNEA